MASFAPNEANANLRNAEVFLYEDDGVTAAAAATNYVGASAQRSLAGTTGALSGVLLSITAIGTAGNATTIATVADGSGAGSMTSSGSAYTFHYQTGVTTVTNLIAAMVAAGFTVGGTYTGSATLAAGDAAGPLAFAGGLDSSLFMRQGGPTWATADGALTNTGIDGDWIYAATQSSLNFTGTEFALRVTKTPTPAFLDLSTKTARCATVVYDKTAIGAAGNATTIAFVADGSGTGALNESAYPSIVFHYASGTTTVANFEAAVVASTHLGVQKYGKWTNVLTATGDTFAATNLAGGLSYKQDIFPFDMDNYNLGAIVEGTYSVLDCQRLANAVLAGPVQNFQSGALEFKSLDGTKTRLTVNVNNNGRITVVIGDLTP